MVISLIYTSCYHICPTTTKHLDKVVGKAQSVLGEDSFNVVTIGFDSANDTADAMRIFAKQQSVKEDNWDFLATDKDTILKFSKQLGFQFFPSPNGFDHLVQTTLLDKNGIVNRQVMVSSLKLHTLWSHLSNWFLVKRQINHFFNKLLTRFVYFAQCTTPIPTLINLITQFLSGSLLDSPSVG